MTVRPRALAPATTILAMLLVLAACTGSTGAPPQASTETAASPTPTITQDVPSTSPTADAPIPTSDGSTPSPTPGVTLTQAWATAPLLDVATGETFRIADLAGKVIIVESMAIWCSSCRAQQGDVQIALESLPDDVVFVVLDVDPNEQAANLAEYQVDNRFQGRYAIAGAGIARALAADFGDQMLNPPSTPMLIIGRDGTVTRTDFGPKSADEIVTLAEAHGA